MDGIGARLNIFLVLHFELCYYVGQEFCIQNKLKYFEGGAQGEHKLAVGLMRLRHSQIILLQILNLKLLLKVFLSKEKTHMDDLYQ